jgi:DNA recombination protein RmuC
MMLISPYVIFISTGISLVLWSRMVRLRALHYQQLQLERSMAAKEIELLREQLNAERNLHAQNSLQLKAQLTAISKSVVYHGQQAIKSENQVQLTTLLHPFRSKIVEFENNLQQQHMHHMQQYASLESLIQLLSKQHHAMNESAQQLTKALKGDQKTQGNWGENTLERLLEISGLQPGIDYFKQHSLRKEETIQRPDFVILLPENKQLIIDSKVSLTAFERFVNGKDALEKSNALKAHVTSILEHIRKLGAKNYSNNTTLHTPHFVVLFLPIEAAFSIAVEAEPNLYQKAWDQRVVVVSPTTLLATLKTVDSLWKQAKQSANAIQIAQEAGRLYDKFVGFLSDMKLIEKKQNEAKAAFESAMNKLGQGGGNIIGKIAHLKNLGAKNTKEIDPDLLGT